MADNKNVDIDYNVKEIIDNLNKSVVLTPEDKRRIEESLDFDKAIESVDISDNNNRVIFTDGEEQLIVEDGEFFLVSSTDSLKTKKKKKREEARNMYIEYFIRYQLNPIIKQRRLDEITKSISKELPNIQKERENKEKGVKKELENKVKKAADRESINIQSKVLQKEKGEKTR